MTRKGFDPDQARDKYGRWTARQLGDAMAEHFGGVHAAQQHPEGKIMAESFYRAQERENAAGMRAARMQGTADKPKSTNPRDVAWAAAIRSGGPAGEAKYILSNLDKFSDKELRQQLRADIFSAGQADQVRAHIRERSFRSMVKLRKTTRVQTAKEEQASIRGNQDRVEFDAKKALANKYRRDPELLTPGQRIKAKNLIARGF